MRLAFLIGRRRFVNAAPSAEVSRFQPSNQVVVPVRCKPQTCAARFRPDDIAGLIEQGAKS